MRTFIILILFAGSELLAAQGKLNKNIDADSSISETSRRFGYFYASVSPGELLNAGIGIQINSDYALGAKVGMGWISGGFNSGGGIGLRVSRRLPYKVFNNINLELTPYLNTTVQGQDRYFFKGIAIETNIGSECTCNVINFVWSIGIICSLAKGAYALFYPNVEAGININF